MTNYEVGEGKQFVTITEAMKALPLNCSGVEPRIVVYENAATWWEKLRWKFVAPWVRWVPAWERFYPNAYSESVDCMTGFHCDSLEYEEWKKMAKQLEELVEDKND